MLGTDAVRELPPELFSRKLKSGLSGSQADAGLQPAGRAEIVGVLHAVGVGLKWKVDIGSRAEGVEREVGGQNADDGVGFPAQRDAFADDVGIGTEASLPQTVRKHHDIPAAGSVFSRGKRAAQGDLRAEQAKELVGDVDSFELLGAVAARHIDARPAAVVRCNIL